MSASNEYFSTQLQPDMGILNINAEFSDGLADGIDRALETFFNYYKYDKVNLKINSPGGSATALTHISQCLSQWKKCGKEIHTEGTFMAASAGALLLSLGKVGTRVVQKYSLILYHHSRVGGSTPVLTAGSADSLANIMRRLDGRMISNLVAHIQEGFGGPAALCDEGAARCTLLQSQSAQIERELDLHRDVKSFKCLSAISKVYRDCSTRSSIAPYLKYLEQRFSDDTSMDVREAYALALIDQVHLVSSLLPCASKPESATQQSTLRLAH